MYIVLYFTIYAVDSIVRVVKEFWYCIYHAENYQVIFNVIFYNKCRSIVHRQGWSQRSDIEFFLYWNTTKYLIFILQYMLQQSASSGVVAEVWYCIFHILKYLVISNVIAYNICCSRVHHQGWSQRSDIAFFIYWNIVKYLKLYSTIYAAAECIVRGGRRGLILLPTWYFATQLCDTHSQRRKY